MKFNTIKYCLNYLVPALVIFSIASTSYFSYTAILVLFGLLPFLELFMKGSTDNMTAAQEAVAKEDKWYDYILYGLVPLQYFILVFFLFSISQEGIPFYVQVGRTIAFGMACGVLGINAAHELGHRNSWQEQLMAKMLLLSTLYMHFFIEHNRGHHKNVSTDEDPASSRYGEWVYTFYFRSVIGSWLSAWKIEQQRVKKLLSWSNEMFRFQVIQLVLVGAIWLVFGGKTLLFYIVGAMIGWILLETVNYIEHYGLRRKKKGLRYEQTLPIHSWNSNHPLGRLVLLELSRHSDHHFMANRKYQTLRHFDESPQMPTGYPGMMLLALIPPLWFWLMHRKIAQLQQGVAVAEHSNAVAMG